MGTIIPKMGTKSAATTRLADALFSPVQQRVLGILFGQPERSFRGSEIITSAASGTGAAHRQLKRLAESGLLTVTRVGNQKHYQANRESPIFTELSGLVLKTSGLAGPLAAALAPFENEISAAFVFGSIAKRVDTAASDVDLMVITDVLHYGELYDALQLAEKTLGRTISLHLSTLDDWRTKRKADHPFVAKVSSQPRIFVLGSEHALA